MRGSSLCLRLQRFGRPHAPFYRIVACQRTAPRDGKFLEILGTYNPLADMNGNKQVTLKVDSVKKWIMRGAEPTDRVAKLLALGEILPPVPRRAVIACVVGRPIEVGDACDQPDPKEVDELHAQLCAQMAEAFDAQKEAFGWAGRELEIL